MPLALSRGSLRPWRRGDEPSLVRYANNRNIWRNLRDRFPHPYTAADADAWITKAEAEAPVTSHAIVVDGETVGGVGVDLGTDVRRRSAEIGYWLGEAMWGRGIATEALKAITAEAFKRFDITRLYALPFADHVASVRVLEKAGYVREGHLRRSAIKDGQVRDQLLFAAYRPL